MAYLMRARALALCLAAALPGLAHAQCRPGPNSNEARLLAYYAVPLAFSPSGVLEPLPVGGVRLAFDLTWIPAPSDELQRTDRCFLPKGENTQLAPVLPRPRVAVGLPAGLVLEATWLPPLTVADATPNMASIALSVVRPVSPVLGVAVRAHATVGEVTGPITCPREALQLDDAGAACYGTAPSEDTYHPNVAGVELALTWRGHRLAGYAGAGLSSLRPRFRVGFQEAGGDYDATRVIVDMSRVTALAGVRWLLTESADLHGEAYAVPEDLTVLRVGASIRVR
ncbi:MAG TPA: hypothetical protein VF178_14920 [Gemmatimonadaceae bacterium]